MEGVKGQKAEDDVKSSERAMNLFERLNAGQGQ